MRSERRTFDAVVVGGGVIGLACAWRAARRGLSVGVFERDAPGAGASGVAAGMLAPVGEATWGEEAFLALALRSHSLWPRFAADLAADSGRELGYLATGALHVAFDRDEAEGLERRFELMRRLDLDAQWLRPSECRRLEPGLGTGVAGGVSAAHEAAVDPRLLVEALRAAAEEAGAIVQSATAVEEVIVAGGRATGVRTATGEEHRAEAVVIAAGAWTSDLLEPEQAPPVRPVKGQIATLGGSPADPVCERIIVTERVYVVPRGDGRLVVGATVEELGFDTRVTAGGVYELLREAYRALPEVAELELVEVTAGLRPGTPDNAPLIGPVGLDGLVLACGHYRNGLLLAPVTAEAVTATLAGEEVAAELGAADPGRFGTAVAR
jgi:glycine oxidase